MFYESKLKKWFLIFKNHCQQLSQEDIFEALIIFLPVLIIAIFLGYENNQIIPVTKQIGNLYLSKNYLKFLANWDGVIYLNIAKYGYNHFYLVNFFPLYPLIIRLIDGVIHSYLDSGLLLSWASFVGALYFYIKIVKNYFNLTNRTEIIKATILWALFPSAIFMLGTFTEALFAFLALGAFYFSLKNQYIKASIMILLATATRINGIFLIPLSALILMKNKLNPKKIILSVTVSTFGLLSYMLYLKIKYNNGLAFLLTQKNHGWLQSSFFSGLNNTSIFNLIFLVIVVISIIYWYQKDKILALYSFLFLMIPIIGGKFGGFPRYTLMDFAIPLMIWSISQKKAWFFNFAIIIFSILWTYLLIQYVGGYIGG